MARSRRFGIAREVFKVVKIAGRLSRDLDKVSEEAASGPKRNIRDGVLSKTNNPTQDNDDYERKFLSSLGDSIARKFYVKLVGVSHLNADGSSRQRMIRKLSEGQVLTLRREPDNPHDPNAILVCGMDGTGAGYLNARLATDVTRSMNKGHRWVCLFRRLVHAPGTSRSGAVICMVKLNNKQEVKIIEPKANILRAPTIIVPRAKPALRAEPQAQLPQSEAEGKIATIVFQLLTGGLLIWLLHGCLN